MLGFFQVCNAALVAPAGDSLDDAALQEAQPIGVDVLDWLDGLVLVVAACHLGVNGAHTTLPPAALMAALTESKLSLWHSTAMNEVV